MAKKRNCRRTAGENIIHEKAVKIRKMTDEQLVHYVENQVEKERSEGFNQGREQTQQPSSVNIEDVLKEIGDIRGIGAAKLNDIELILNKVFGGESGMLAIGDRVVMNNKYHVPEMYRGKEFIVTAGPRKVSGTMCVWLDGYRGCYAEDGLTKVGDGDA